MPINIYKKGLERLEQQKQRDLEKKVSQKSRFKEVHQVLSMECATNTEQTNAPQNEQVGGTHYQGMAIEPIDFIMKNGLSFAEGNVVKYLCRYRAKGGREDLLKAKQYIDFLLQQHYPESGTKK